MYIDNNLTLCASQDVKASGALSTFVSLGGLNPDIGNGQDIYAVINVETYTAGSSTGTTIDLVTSVDDGSTVTAIVSSTGLVAAAAFELADDAGRIGGAPIVLKINPQHLGAYAPGTADMEIGLRFTHATDDCTAFTATAHLVVGYPSRIEASHQASGFTIR